MTISNTVSKTRTITQRLSLVEPDFRNNFNLLRFIAASGVLLSHAYPIALGPQASQPLEDFLGLTLGHLCVLVFFSISGFFITRSFDRSGSLGRFLRARVLRLFPALVVVLLLTVLVCGLWLTRAPAATFWAAAPEYVLRNLTLVKLQYDLPGVFTDVPYGTAINGSLWTLFYEAFCYLGVALLGVAGAFARPKIALAAVAAVVVACSALLMLPEPISENLPPRLEKLVLLALPFALGSGFYLLRAVVLLHPLAALGLLAASLLFRETAWFLPLFVTAVCYAVLTLGYARIPWLLSYNKVGDYSYGVYIYAFPLQQLGAELGYTNPLANMAFSAPITLLCAVLSWHAIEKPALALKARQRRATSAEHS